MKTVLLNVWLGLLLLEVINLLGLPYYLTTLLGYARIPILAAYMVVGGMYVSQFFSYIGVALLGLPVAILLLEFRNPITKELLHIGEDNTHTLTIYQLNVCYSNNEMANVTQQIQRYSPDVVVLCETNAKWIEYLRDHFEQSHYAMFTAGEGTSKKDTGRVTLSRYPIIGRPEYIEQTNAYDIITRIQVRDSELTVVNTHPEACLGYTKYNQQKADWQRLFAAIEPIQGEHIAICGDFNVTPWHYYYRKLVKYLPHCYDELLNVLCFTFPVWLGPLMCLNLDHCLVSDSIRILEQERCKGVNSDHYPIFTTISL